MVWRVGVGRGYKYCIEEMCGGRAVRFIGVDCGNRKYSKKSRILVWNRRERRSQYFDREKPTL